MGIKYWGSVVCVNLVFKCECAVLESIVLCNQWHARHNQECNDYHNHGYNVFMLCKRSCNYDSVGINID